MIGEGAVNFLLPFCTVDFFHFYFFSFLLLFLTAINLSMFVSMRNIAVNFC
jgi:hypothetical protein